MLVATLFRLVVYLFSSLYAVCVSSMLVFCLSFPSALSHCSSFQVALMMSSNILTISANVSSEVLKLNTNA